MPTPTGFTSIYTSTEIDDAIGAVQTKADKSTTTTAGTYKSVTVNSSGIVTGGSNPTTLAGYGITDAYTKSEVDGVVDDYLPLTGGTISTNSAYPLTIADSRSSTSLFVATRYMKGSTSLGFLGFSAQDIPAFINHNASTTYSLLHTGNFIAGTDYQAPIPANTYAPYNSSGYLPKNGGEMTGHIYMDGASTSSSTANTSQMIFRAGGTQQIAISSNPNSLIINPTSSGTTGQIVLGVNGKASYFTSSGNFGIGTASPSQKLHVNGVVKCTSVDTSSDERMKNKVGDITINVEDIANAPNVTFKWKEGEDTENIHGGTFAQYWEKITPYYVHGDEEKSMDYASLSLSCAIELAKEVVQLKEENAQLKREIAEIKEMLNKLNK